MGFLIFLGLGFFLVQISQVLSDRRSARIAKQDQERLEARIKAKGPLPPIDPKLIAKHDRPYLGPRRNRRVNRAARKPC